MSNKKLISKILEPQEPRIKYLLFSGGGAKGAAYIGANNALIDYGILQKLEKLLRNFQIFGKTMVIKLEAELIFYHEIIINRSFLFLKLLDEKNSTLKIRELYNERN